MKRIFCFFLAMCLCVSLGAAAFASGEAGSGEAFSGYENRPVFFSGVYEMESAEAVTASFTLYGYYNTTDASAEDAFTVIPFAPGTTAAVYTAEDAAQPLEGVTAAFDGETLSLTFAAPPAEEVYGYVVFSDGETDFTPVPVYVVSYGAQAYLNAETSYNGYALRYDANTYTPGAVYYETGLADSIMGGAIDLFAAADFAEEIKAAAEEYGYDYYDLYAAVDWYLNNGSTTGGDTWEEFLTDRTLNVNPTDATDPVHVGDGFLRVEACYYLFRYYWMNNTTYEVTVGDAITGIFSDNMNKLFPDFNDFFWGHYYCTWFQCLNPGLRSGFLFKYDSVVDPDGSNTNERGMYMYREELGVEGQLAYEIDTAINYGDFLNMIYNVITGGHSSLNAAGETAKTALLAAGGASRAANAAAVNEYFGLGLDLNKVMEEKVTKWAAVMILYKLRGTSDGIKDIPDENMEDTYLYNTTKWGDLAYDTYLDTATYYERKGISDYIAESNQYGLTTMAAVTVSPAATVDEAVWAGCSFYYVGDYVIVLDNTAIVDKAETTATGGTIWYQAGYSAAEYGGEKTYVPLAFSYALAEDGSLILSGVEGYPSFASGTAWNAADVGSFYCSGLWIRDGAEVALTNTTVLAQASGTGDDIKDDAHRFFGGGDGLQVTDAASVTVKNDDGQIFLIGTGGTAAGSIYAGGASTTVVENTTLRNASGHPFSIFYNGIFVLDGCTTMNSGRIFNSDASSGTVIFNDTIAVERSGASVMDETCSAHFVNSFVTKLSGWEVNGNAQAIFNGTTVESGGSFNYSNKTSMTSDVGEVVLVNSSFLNTSGTLLNATRGGRGYFRAVDSSITWSGDGDTTLISVGGPNSWTGAAMYVDVDAASQFPTAFSVAVAGDCYNSVRGWNDDVLAYDSNSLLYLDIDQVIQVKMDCSDTVVCSFGMVGVTDKFYATGNVIFVDEAGAYVYTGLDDSGTLYNPELAAVTENGDGTATVVYTLSDGSTMTYLNLPYAG